MVLRILHSRSAVHRVNFVVKAQQETQAAVLLVQRW